MTEAPGGSHRDYKPAGRRPGARVQKFLRRKLHLPLSVVHPSMRAARAAARPGEVWRRRRAARAIAATLAPAERISRDAGHRLFGPDLLPGAREAAARCADLFEKARARYDEDWFVKNPKKRFLLSILAGPEFAGHPDLLRFALSRPVLDRAAVYLGGIPLLSSIDLWWSPANETTRSSQLFHVDIEDSSQCKLFLYCTDTGEDQGPLTFLPADVSDLVRAKIADPHLLDDERVAEAGGRGREVRVLGPAASGAFLDTSRCLHFGSRGNRSDRLVLSVQFLRFEAPLEPTLAFVAPPDLADLELDPIQRMALRSGSPT